MSSWAPPPSRWKRRFWSMLCLNHAVFHLFSSLFNPLARFHVASPSFVLKTAVFSRLCASLQLSQSAFVWATPLPPKREPWVQKLWVRELYVRTLRSGTLCSNPGFEELYVRALGSGTLCPNPGSGNSMFKPGSGTLCSNPGLGNSMFQPRVRQLYVRTLGSGTL